MVILNPLRMNRRSYRSVGRLTTAASTVLLPTLAIVACFLPSFGCSGPRRTQPEVNPAGLSDVGFQGYLSETPMVTVDEAYRAMLILADGEDVCRSFEERRTKLESRGIARAAWRLKPEDVIDTGSVAFMVTRICRIHGGVNAHLLGSWGLGDRRYAIRELVYRELLEDTVDYQYMSGTALVALMSKADEIMEKKGLYESPKIDLSDKTDRDPQGNLIVPAPLPVPEPPATQSAPAED